MRARSNAYGQGPADFQREGGGGPVAAPIRIAANLNVDDGLATVPMPLGTVAVELDRRSSCGPILVDETHLLWPGGVFYVADAAKGAFDLRAPYLFAVTTTKAAPAGGYGTPIYIARLICHQDLRTVPPGGDRPPVYEEHSIPRFPIDTTRRDLVQVCVSGYSQVTILGWADTGGASWNAEVEFHYAPDVNRIAASNYQHTRLLPPVVVPVGTLVGIIIYSGATDGAHLVRVVGSVVAGTSIGLAHVIAQAPGA